MRSVRMLSSVIVFIFSSLLVHPQDSSSNATLYYSPGGTYTDWFFPRNQDYFSLEWTFIPVADPPPSLAKEGLLHYYAYNFGLVNQTNEVGGGYAGFQSNGLFNDMPEGKVINFSIWGSTDGKTTGLLNRANTESGGVQIMYKFPWVLGHRYYFELKQGPSGEDTLGKWWGLWVTDKNSGKTTFIGEQRVPARINGKPAGCWSAHTSMFGEDLHWWRSLNGQTKYTDPSEFQPSSMAAVDISANGGKIRPIRFATSLNSGQSVTGDNGFKSVNSPVSIYQDNANFNVQQNLGYWRTPAPNAIQHRPKPPIMGWSSWNNFRIHIDEKIIRQQADAMVSSGLYDAGYRFINIDDGYFGGRDPTGKLYVDSGKFPSGMKALVNYIHAKNLKTGIYSDAGKNTCGSMWDKDPKGVGSGMFGHIDQDCDLFFRQWGFDFLKVDWCGGDAMKLDEQTEYTRIISAVKSIDSNIVFNVCRWKFPGVWAIREADSWRISGDISAKFSSILAIVDSNARLANYASAGHYNDMDMLQVGRGMSYEEDKAHFSMWCMLNSPLLAGNDLRAMSRQTIDILTNKELIALNQDPAFTQATRAYREGNVEVWIKPLGANKERSIAVAILNRGENEIVFDLSSQKVGVSPNSRIRDLWLHRDLGRVGSSKKFILAKHGIVILRIL